MWKIAFKKYEEVCSALGGLHTFKIFKGCLPRILLDTFLNTFTQIIENVLYQPLIVAKHPLNSKLSLPFSIYSVYVKQIRSFLRM